MLIYKYQSINNFFWSNFRNNQLWFASPRDFEDIFDSDLPLDTNYERNEIEAVLRTSYILNFKTEIGFDKFLIGAVDKLTTDVIFRKKFFYGILEEQAKDRTGITCFSKDEINEKLWATYTDKYTGVCFTFNTDKDIEYFKPLEKVIYVDKLPKIRVWDDFPTQLKKYMTTKKKCWEEQNEIRSFRHKPGGYKYDPKSLKEITFGCKVLKSDIQKIVSIGLQLNSELEFFKIHNLDGELNKSKYLGTGERVAFEMN